MTRLQAEIDALQYLLADFGDNESRPIADQLSVSDGMETPLASYLADELSAPVEAEHEGSGVETGNPNLSAPAGCDSTCRFCNRCPSFNGIIGWGWHC